MNALSYVASDPYVQIAFLALIAFTVGASLLADRKRRRDELDLRQTEFRHRAQMEIKQFDRELGAVDGGKALPALRSDAD